MCWWRKPKQSVGYKEQLLSFVSQYDLTYFLDCYFSLTIDGRVSQGLTYDSFVFYGDRILRILSESQTKMTGKKKKGFNLEVLLRIMKSSEGEAQPTDTVTYRREMDDPFKLMGQTFYRKETLTFDAINKRYLGKLSVSVLHFILMVNMLENRKDLLEQEVGISPEYFSRFLIACVSLSQRGPSPSVDLSELSSLFPKSIFNKALTIVERNWLSGFFKAYEISGRLYAVNFELLEQEGFYLYVDYLRTINASLADNIMNDRGPYLETQIIRLLEHLFPKEMIYHDVFIDDQEADVVVLFENLCFAIEAKSTKYDSTMLETGQDNNCKKMIIKATQQLSLIKNSLENDHWAFRKKGNAKKQFLPGHFTVAPLIITFDDYFGLSTPTSEEAKKKDYAFNPLILSLDDFAGICERTNDPLELFAFVLQTSKARENAVVHTIDNYFDFMVFRKGTESLPKSGEMISSSLVRQEAYAESFDLFINNRKFPWNRQGAFQSNDVAHLIQQLILKHKKCMPSLFLFYGQIMQCKTLDDLCSPFGLAFRDSRIFFTKKLPSNLRPNSFYVLLDENSQPIEWFNRGSSKDN